MRNLYRTKICACGFVSWLASSMAPADVVPDPQAVSTGGAHVLAIAASWVATIPTWLFTNALDIAECRKVKKRYLVILDRALIIGKHLRRGFQ